jgi:hypothetical protein
MVIGMIGMTGLRVPWHVVVEVRVGGEHVLILPHNMEVQTARVWTLKISIVIYIHAQVSNTK